MALISEAELWAAGDASSGGVVRSRGGASEEAGTWNTDEEVYSGNDRTWRRRKKSRDKRSAKKEQVYLKIHLR